MKYYLSFSVALITLVANACFANKATIPSWNFFTYMEGNNTLASFVGINIGQMQKVGSTSDVNILAQWDLPGENYTNRYKILQNNTAINASFKQEMGIDPVTEIPAAMQWATTTYPAQRYALVLWDHGNGVLDRSKKPHELHSWLGLLDERDRGILYNEQLNTFLDNVGLSTVCTQIKTTLGQNLDFLGADACLMAMIEIAYQIRGSVNYFVCSQETEPGYGWPYTQVLSSLVGMPSMSTASFAQAVVQAYSNFYSSGKNADSSHTLSAINIGLVPAAVTTFNTLVQALGQAQLIDKTTTNTAIKNARAKTQAFYIKDYIDVIDFCDNLTTQFTALKVQGKNKKATPRQNKLSQSATNILASITTTRGAIQACITASQTGKKFNGKAHGLSIYFPASLVINSSYTKTDFYQQTGWGSFITSLRS